MSCFDYLMHRLCLLDAKYDKSVTEETFYGRELLCVVVGRELLHMGNTYSYTTNLVVRGEQNRI